MTIYRPRLRRNTLDRVLGGLCGGISNCLGISAWWVRAVFGLLFLNNALIAVLLYALLWVMVPLAKPADLPPLQRPETEFTVLPHPESVLTISMFCVLGGILLLTEQTGVLRSASGIDLLAPAILFVIGLVVLSKNVRGVA
jgi:phage shock protein PspC (stress-responsive transcriptional regulator)